MTYEQLMELVKEMGKTSDDLCRWFAQSDVQAIRDMTDKEMIEWLIDGPPQYDHHYVKVVWEGLDEPVRLEYVMYMTDYWFPKES